MKKRSKSSGATDCSRATDGGRVNRPVHETNVVCILCDGFGILLGSRWGEYHRSKCDRCRGTGLINTDDTARTAVHSEVS